MRFVNKGTIFTKVPHDHFSSRQLLMVETVLHNGINSLTTDVLLRREMRFDVIKLEESFHRC